jgi:hypothetical protein
VRRPATAVPSETAHEGRPASDRTPGPRTRAVRATPRIYAPLVGAQDDLWAELHDLFDADDGSLPEVAFVDASPREVQALFAFLVQRGSVDAGFEVWDKLLEAAVPLFAVPDAGARVASGQVTSFHLRLDAIEVEGTVLPQLGAFICADEVALDYRAGTAWTPAVLAAFARLLAELRARAPSAGLHARPDGMPERADPRFVPAFDRYLASCGISPPQG